jgi:hypothetical protein
VAAAGGAGARRRGGGRAARGARRWSGRGAAAEAGAQCAWIAACITARLGNASRARARNLLDLQSDRLLRCAPL